MNPLKGWLIVALVFVIIEILPPPTHFFCICVALGALAAAVTVAFTSIPWAPWVAFGVVTVALTPLLIPLAKFLFAAKPHASNVDALIGVKVLVTGRIDPKAAGTVKIHGESWRACSEDLLDTNEWAMVTGVEGTHLIVRRIP